MKEIDLYKNLGHTQIGSLIACLEIVRWIGLSCETGSDDSAPYDIQIEPTDETCTFDSCEVWLNDGTNVFVYPADNEKEIKIEFQCYLDDDPRAGEKVYTVNLSNWASETLDALRDWGAPLKITE